MAMDVNDMYQQLKTQLADVVPDVELRYKAELAVEINRLKKERNAVILGHNYMEPVLYHSVTDIRGDSLELSRKAAETDKDIIVFCGVYFMAETAKILNPSKTVLIPARAGCSLAAGITAEDVRKLRERFPGVPVVSYINTYASVKAESDICCTSANALQVVESLDADKVIFLPDEFLGHYVASQTKKQIVLWKGHCEVHEKFTAGDLRTYRDQYPGIVILAHPECAPDVLSEADFVGSTAGMIGAVSGRKPRRVLMVTECSMSDNVAVEFPQIEFVRHCNLCPHMKLITLPKILDSLRSMQHVVEVDAVIAERARNAVRRMLEIGSPKIR